MTCLSASALDKKALQDSLSTYINSFARVGKVKITRIRVDQERAEIFTNKSISYLSLDEERIARLRQIAHDEVFGEADGQCLIFTDGYELSELQSETLHRDLHYTLPPERHPLVSNTSRQYKADRGLDGFHIALYGSHGLYFNQKDERWTFQRARLLSTVEDLYTTSYTMPFLVPMLENAGAVVIQPRERDTQLNEVVCDDADPLCFSGSDAFKAVRDGGFGMPQEPLTEGQNPFCMGGYSIANANPEHEKTTKVRYTPAIPEAGEYAVYVSYKSLKNSSNNVQYTVMHNGETTTYAVNQRMGGGTWVYLGTHFFSQDTGGNYLTLSNHGKAGTVVTTDAVRFGGGMGSVARYATKEAIDNIKSSDSVQLADSPVNQFPDSTVSQLANFPLTSGFPRYIEGARYWMQYSGIPDSVYNFTESKNDYIDDYASRGRWMNWLIGGSAAYPQGKGLKIPVHLGLAFHTDAGLTKNDSIVGSLIIYMNRDDEKHMEYPTGISRLTARNLADMMQTQIVEDIRQTYAPEWQRRELMNSSYSEARNPKIPVVLLELLSHQNPADMRYGLDPNFRFLVSRAIYKGMLRFLHEQYGTKYVVQPLPVCDFAVSFAGSDSLRLTWSEQTDSLEETANADYYIVYTRLEGHDWDNGIKMTEAEYTFMPEKDKHYDFRIAAGNRGGISMMSQTLSARIDSQAKGRILIVNGFDRVSAPEFFCLDSTYFGFTTEAVPYGKEVNYIGRQYEFDRRKPWVTNDDGGFGSSYMDHADCWYVGNTFDYPSLHGKALDTLHFSYISTAASALNSVPEGIDAVDLILGKQKLTRQGTRKQTTAYPTFTPEMRTLLTDYLGQGGRLLLSGAYITSDEAADKAFLADILHIKQASRHATRSGRVTLAIPGEDSANCNLLTEPNTHTLHTENPDGIAPTGDEAKAVARYRDSFVAAAVASENAESGAKTLVFAFPLESLQDFGTAYTQSVRWLTTKH